MIAEALAEYPGWTRTRAPGGLGTLIAGPLVLTSATRGDRLEIAVTDRGPGIPAEDLPKIFERFYRVDKARARKQGGAGLGLAIAKTIVEAHQGTIVAQSQVGHGTTMTIRLPLTHATPHATMPR